MTPRKQPRTVPVKGPDGQTCQYEVGPDVDLEREIVRDSRGRRITAEYVQRVVEDTQRVLRGRPSLSTPGAESPQLRVRVPEALYGQLEEAAGERHVSRSVIVREALESYFAAHRR